MAPVTWTLRSVGLGRTRGELVDEAGDVVAVLRRSRWRASRFARATRPDGTAIAVARRGEDLEIRRDDEVRATVSGADLAVGDRSFLWRVAQDGSREARVTDGAGSPRVPLSIRAPVDRDGPAWAEVQVDDALPEAPAVVVAACAELLRIGGSGHWKAPKPPMPGGPDDSGNGDDRAAAVRYGGGWQ